jgi:hypothetical protein
LDEIIDLDVDEAVLGLLSALYSVRVGVGVREALLLGWPSVGGGGGGGGDGAFGISGVEIVE